MKLTTDQVKKVAKLANLPITDEETDRYAEQLSKILDYVGELNSVDTKNVEPTYNVTGLNSVMRPDEASESFSQEDALQNGSHVKDGYFVTKGVFKEE